MRKYVTRMGDGFKTELTESELEREIEQGAGSAAESGRIETLNEEDRRRLLEIFKCPDRSVGVDRGKRSCSVTTAARPSSGG